MNKLVKLLFTFLIFSTLYSITVSEVQAQTFSLTPLTASKSAGLNFNVDLSIDTAGKEVSGADVKITFDSTILQVVDITEGTFFPEVTHNTYSGTLYIGGSFSTDTDSKSGTGKVATIVLKGKTAGVGKLTFVCTTQATDTNILDTAQKDIVNCTALKDGSYTIIGTSSVTATPAQTDEEATSSPEPPVTGISLPTVLSFGFGLALLALGLVFVL